MPLAEIIGTVTSVIFYLTLGMGCAWGLKAGLCWLLSKRSPD